ncbi:MAG TPA: type I 3-dehydroquinate dehydratase [Thermoanaerobaculia bacterium]|nr:type I 3-dehydroquinate dehydratase [Thermoanaerobaculia bacterium]
MSVCEARAEAAREGVESAAGAEAIELRADAFSRRGDALDLASFRAATRAPLVFTRRGAGFDAEEASRVLGAGFDFIDVEYDGSLSRSLLGPFRTRTILSHHDFAAVPDLEPLIRTMSDLDPAFVKIAVTPRRFEDNIAILEALDRNRGNLALFGMSSAGLYSRILAPFFGSALAFVSASEQRPAAPSQFSLARARLYWGDRAELQRPEAIFAVVGNPIGHSLSPAIHNPRFRELGVDAAYSIAEVSSLEDVASGVARALPFYPTGISITAPFKEDGFRFAVQHGASISARAQACMAINTLVRRVDGTLVGDNTDVDGIAAAIRSFGRLPVSAAVIGGGGSARAAVVALLEAGAAVRLFVREPERVHPEGFGGTPVAPLASLEEFDGDLLVNAVSSEVVLPYPQGLLREGLGVIDLAYTKPRLEQLELLRRAGVDTVDGLAVLEGQAAAQSKLFMLAVPGVRA